jgi:hypothetical protein
MNAISKSGGDSFRGSFLINGSWPALQGSNVTSRLNSRGVQNVSNSLKKLYDINGAVGGPIKKDKVWFYFTSRYFTNEYYMAGQFYPVNPAAAIRVDDTCQRKRSGRGRPTTSPHQNSTVKQKISGQCAYPRKDDPHWLQQILFIA